jgi:hypothetical protein
MLHKRSISSSYTIDHNSSLQEMTQYLEQCLDDFDPDKVDKLYRNACPASSLEKQRAAKWNQNTITKDLFSLQFQESQLLPDTVASSDCSSSLSDLENRSVKFQSVSVREYELTVGNHSRPYALTLDWAHTDTMVYDMEEYESQRARLRKRKGIGRIFRVAKISANERLQRLSNVTGLTDRELYKLEQHRESMDLPDSALDLDELDDGRHNPYELADMDEFDYHKVDI